MALENISSDVSQPADPQAAVKADFAERLRAALNRKGWTPSEAVRQVSRFLTNGDKFGRAHMWQYLQGRALPRSRYLLALSRALDVDPGELLPERPVAPASLAPFSFAGTAPSSSSPAEVVHVRDYGDGTALLDVVQRVPWGTALKVIHILKPRNP